MKLDVSSSIKAAKTFVTANSPALLTGTAIIGTIATAVLSAHAGYKARGMVDAAEVEKGLPLTNREKAELTWLCYATPAVTTISTVASVVGVHTIHTRHHAALAGMYALTAGRMDEYKNRAEELLGAKKTQQLGEDLAQKEADRNPIINNEVVLTDGGDQLCFDQWNGRYFTGSVAKIEAAVNTVNKQINDDGEVSLNDFYDALGLGPCDSGASFGWNGHHVEVRYGSVLTPDGRPANTFWFHTEPKANLGRG